LSLVAIVARDLMVATRITNAAEAAGHDVIRVDDPSGLPASRSVAVVFIDWAERDAVWSQLLAAWRHYPPESVEKSPKVVLFGPHSDMEAHADARASGLGPMLARSKLIASLPRILGYLD
jgi:hypothetical protein